LHQPRVEGVVKGAANRPQLRTGEAQFRPGGRRIGLRVRRRSLGADASMGQRGPHTGPPGRPGPDIAAAARTAAGRVGRCGNWSNRPICRSARLP
jgi:hypothetical protein